jgi:glycosyltransferase involved in cell wall biosynthesis
VLLAAGALELYPSVVGGTVVRTIERLGIEDAVHFVSGVSDERIYELYSEAELAVVPSLYEGFSIPAVEAMSCATPLVASRGGALPEVVGDCGVLVEPGNPSELASALGALLDDPARRAALRVAGQARAAEFDWPVVAAAVLRVYRAAVAADPRRVPGRTASTRTPAGR